MDVVGIGVPYFDMVINVDKMPKMDEGTRANAVFHQGGGKVATAMATVGRLGKKAGMIARVGSNRSGQFIIQDFKYNGVNTDGIIVDKVGTSSSFCLSLSEQISQKRIFIGTAGTAQALQPEDIDFDYLKQAQILQVEHGDATTKAAVKFAKQNGIVTVIDADSYEKEIEEMLPDLDVFIASEFFYQKMFGDLEYCQGCQRLLTRGPKIVIITLGNKGSVGQEKGEEMFTCPCFSVDVVDTTGAGDVFHGAYIVGMLEGMNTKECVRFASAVSAIKCTYPGGRTGIPNREVVELFLTTGRINDQELEERYSYYQNNL